MTRIEELEKECDKLEEQTQTHFDNCKICEPDDYCPKEKLIHHRLEKVRRELKGFKEGMEIGKEQLWKSLVDEDGKVWTSSIRNHLIKEGIEIGKREEVFNYDKGFTKGTLRERERVGKLIDEIGEKFYYSSELDGVSLKLNGLQEYQDFKESKLKELKI